MTKTKHRSPNYPRLAFDAALEKARAIYEQQRKHSASREVIAQALGYTTFNGASQAAITAVKHYGLLEPAGDVGAYRPTRFECLSCQKVIRNRLRRWSDRYLRRPFLPICEANMAINCH